MLQDVKGLRIKKNLVGEWSIYKVTRSNKQEFLLFSFTEQREAVEKGRALARLFNLGVQVDGDIPSEEKKPQDSRRRRRVKGVTRLCRELVQKKVSFEEIEDILVEKYLDAGYSEKEARWSARGIISGVLKGHG